MEPTTAAYSELKTVYDVFNERLFGGQLPPCLITLQRKKRTYGYFSSNRFGSRDGHSTDEIAINPEYFAVVPLVEVFQTIAHEQTHLWQARFGTPGRARYHNEEWANKMESIGLMPSHTGQPGGRRVGDQMADYMIEGGLFSQVVHDLVEKQGFRISWFDRFVPQRVVPSFAAQGYTTVPAAALEMPSASSIGVVAPPSKLGTTTPLDRSNRVKYSCSGCRLNVWGKPLLRLACQECQLDLECDAEIAPELHARQRRPRMRQGLHS